MRAGIVGYEVACPVDEDADEDEEDDAQQRDATTELARMLWSQRSSSSSLAVRDRCGGGAAGREGGVGAQRDAWR